jgi:death-on-curing protein
LAQNNNNNYQDLTYEEIVTAHSDMQARPHSKIVKGIQKQGLLESIAQRPSQKFYNHESFPDIYSKCASLMEAIIQWHPFVDGNKRTGLVVAHMYMHKNNHYLVTPFDSARFTVLVAQKKKNFEEIRQWVKIHTAHNHHEYTTKYRKYVKEPAKEVIALYNTKQVDKIKKANAIMNEWLAIDIYPQYKGKEIQTILWLAELIDKYSSPNAAPPPPPPPPSL